VKEKSGGSTARYAGILGALIPEGSEWGSRDLSHSVAVIEGIPEAS